MIRLPTSSLGGSLALFAMSSSIDMRLAPSGDLGTVMLPGLAASGSDLCQTVAWTISLRIVDNEGPAEALEAPSDSPRAIRVTMSFRALPSLPMVVFAGLRPELISGSGTFLW